MPRTSRPLQVFPIALRRAEVARAADLTPNMRRVTLTGDELLAGEMGDGFERAPFRSNGFDDHVKLVVPPADGTLPRIGTQEQNRFAWNPEVLAFTRDYTVRGWDPDANTLDIDVVRHDHGLAAEWAFRVRPGDEVHFAGPKSSGLFQEEAEWHLLVGDETALPAIGRWLEEAPAGTRGRAIVEIPTEQDRQEIVTAADVDVEWLVRGNVPLGASGLMLEAVRRVRMPEGRVYAWCAGEAMTIAPIRRYLRRDLGLPKDDVEVVGYWRLPKVVSDSTVDGSPPARDDAERLVASPGNQEEDAQELVHEVHEMTELAPPVVTRVAVTLGVGFLIGSGVTTLDGLSKETGVDADRLRVLLDAMTALGLVERDGPEFHNTAKGGVLMDESATDELSLDNPANREALALVDLLDVLRSGPADGPADAPTGWRARRAEDPALDAAYQDRNADALQYMLDPLARLAPVAAASTLAVVGDAAYLVAEKVARGRTIQLPGTATSTPWPAHDCAILICTLEGRSDDGALELLRAALGSGPALVLAERTADKAATDDHTAEYALTSLTLTGSPLRTRADIGDLLGRAGATSVQATTLGWGFGPFGTVIVAFS